MVANQGNCPLIHESASATCRSPRSSIRESMTDTYNGNIFQRLLHRTLCI